MATSVTIESTEPPVLVMVTATASGIIAGYAVAGVAGAVVGGLLALLASSIIASALENIAAEQRETTSVRST